MKEGFYSWANQSFNSFDSTVVMLDTDEGLFGMGESCPLGPSYLAAYAEGVRTGIATIAPDLIGMNPCHIDLINEKMDQLLKGHPYVKSAIDMACWDVFGKLTGMPVYQLLGGKLQDAVKLFKVVPRTDPDLMAELFVEYRNAGFEHFQIKVGENPSTDIERFKKVIEVMTDLDVVDADANTGWSKHEALTVISAVTKILEEKRLSCFIEQPCLSYKECLSVRRHTSLPFILDECMDGIPIILEGFYDNAMDLINLKINRVGGLTRARKIRDLCVHLGIPMTIEDSWGGEIATAAIAHLALSTPADFHFQSSAFHEYSSVSIAQGGPEVFSGYMSIAADAVGLGVYPNLDVLGAPLIDLH